MTIAGTRADIKALPAMTAAFIAGEWRVTIDLYCLSERFRSLSAVECEEKQEALAYYTDGEEDALATARVMSEEWRKSSAKARYGLEICRPTNSVLSSYIKWFEDRFERDSQAVFWNSSRHYAAIMIDQDGRAW